MTKKLTLDSRDILGRHQEDIKRILEGREDIKRTLRGHGEKIGRTWEENQRTWGGNVKDI